MSIRLGKRVSLLTGGKDPHYALGLLYGLVSAGTTVEFIGNDEMKDSIVTRNENVIYFNLRGDQNPHARKIIKIMRVLIYYYRLLKYAAKTKSNIFHILWLNKFTYFDRTVLNVYYKILGKKLIYTAHNVNEGERDGKDSWLNRLSLKFLYRRMDHIFVHTEKMKEELITDFEIPEQNVTVIPFSVNNVIPRTGLARIEARQRLHLQIDERIALFFGNIAPYKGLDILITSLGHLKKNGESPRLLIAGRVKDDSSSEYWDGIQTAIEQHDLNGEIIKSIQYIPDKEVELYFKAADVLVLPYRHIFQSGVLLLSYSFGLPVIATDVGSLKHFVIEGQTGFICKPEDPEDIADKIRQYFNSDLYWNLEANRAKIIGYANDQYSWEKGARITHEIYHDLQ